MNKEIRRDLILLTLEKIVRGFIAMILSLLILGLLGVFVAYIFHLFGVWSLIGILSTVLLSWGIGHMMWRGDPNFYDDV